MRPFYLHRLTRPRELPRRRLSTSEVGQISGEAAGGPRERVDGRFQKGNPRRWEPGKSGNPSGRPRKPEDEHNRILRLQLDLIGNLKSFERRLAPARDERFEKFKVHYGFTGNAFRSALRAGYAPKTAKSKAYLLARRATDAE